MPNLNEYDQPINQANSPERNGGGREESKQNVESSSQSEKQPEAQSAASVISESASQPGEGNQTLESGRPMERTKGTRRPGARGTAAMDPQTRKEVARKGGLAVSRNRQHMAEIGRKGGQTVSKNREHMAQIGRKGGAASRGHR